MENQGCEFEKYIIKMLVEKEKVTIKEGRKNLEITVKSLLDSGNSTSWKADIILNGIGYQVKSTASNRASVVNQTPLRNFQKLEAQGFDISAPKKAFQILEGKGFKTLFLKDYFQKKEWKKLLEYFIFEGTATRQADKYAQASYLLEEKNGKLVRIPKDKAVDKLWKNLVFEQRQGRGKIPEVTLSVRYR